MKIKNLAFFGIMASILGVSAANAAADNTVLTTKAYVDKGDTAAAATALQSAQSYVTTQLEAYTPTANLAAVATSGSYNDLENKPTIPTNANFVENTINSGHTDIAPSGAAVSTALAGKQPTIDSSHKLEAGLVSGLATVATSGDYDDLTDKPTLGALAAKSEVTGTDIAANANIAATQLSTAVQSALTAAGTALQSGNNVSLLNNDAGYQNSTQVGSAIDTEIGKLDATVTATTGEVVTSITETDGKISSVVSTKIANANVADNAAIATTKLAAPAVDLNNEAYTCPAGARCVVTYKDGHYSLTPMNTVADETTTGA